MWNSMHYAARHISNNMLHCYHLMMFVTISLHACYVSFFIHRLYYINNKKCVGQVDVLFSMLYYTL